MNKFIVAGSVLMLTFLVSIFSGAVYATQASTDTEVELNVSTVINISTPDTTTINCASLNTLCTNNTTITVGTNNITGYTLQLNATSGYSNSLTNAATSETIPTLAQAYAAGSFPTNYWGYTGGLDKSGETGGLNCSANYCPILAYQSNDSNYAPNHAIKVTDAPATASNTTITFGAKADITKPSGTYTTSVTFTAVANATSGPSLNGMYMQDIDSEVCASVTDIDTTYTVIDIRDDNEYTVAKLQDGNCWMTQNLALGSDEEIELTSDDSNVDSEGFFLPASVAEGDWAESTTDPEVFDYVDNYDDSSTKYGNYYNWSAATAGSGSDYHSGVRIAPYDICPKNWRLPSASSTGNTDNEFYIMLNNYITSSSWQSSHWSGATVVSELTAAPISFVLSGSYSGDLYGQGAFGKWWSSTSFDGDNAGGLSVNSSGVYSTIYPNGGSQKEYDFSVRCLVPGA